MAAKIWEEDRYMAECLTDGGVRGVRNALERPWQIEKSRCVIESCCRSRQNGKEDPFVSHFESNPRPSMLATAMTSSPEAGIKTRGTDEQDPRN